MILAFEPEPSSLMRAFEATQTKTMMRLCPWRLPVRTARFAPRPLARFVNQRSQSDGRGLPGFPLLELGARAWAGHRTDRILHSRFLFRWLSGRWAAHQRQTSVAKVLIAPSCAARSFFSAAPAAKKILIHDMPGLRRLHEDLDFAAAQHRDCLYLNRYRAPDWAIVDQEVEWQLADEIYVRGRFAHQLLLDQGVAEEKIFVFETPAPQPVQRELRPADAPLRVLLAGLASARHGTNELLRLLESRPWLEVYARAGEGTEPAAFLQHERVHAVQADTLSRMDALLVPSFCETYLPELRVATASGIPIIASLRGAGSVPRARLFAELPLAMEHALGEALDCLQIATRSGLRLVGG